MQVITNPIKQSRTPPMRSMAEVVKAAGKYIANTCQAMGVDAVAAAMPQPTINMGADPIKAVIPNQANAPQAVASTRSERFPRAGAALI
jgi:hypothetical protein